MKPVARLALAACLALGSCTSGPSGDGDNIAQNVALGRRVFTEIYGAGKVSLVDELYTDDFVDDSPGGGKGRDRIKEAVAEFHKTFPDLRIDMEDAFAIDDKVVLRYAAHGTQTGPYGQIPPTGMAVTVRGITIFGIVNGKIKTEWTEYDRLGVLRQLRIVPY
jgi:steroid delta-isomerase-like uncharacterized protein